MAGPRLSLAEREEIVVGLAGRGVALAGRSRCGWAGAVDGVAGGAAQPVGSARATRAPPGAHPGHGPGPAVPAAQAWPPQPGAGAGVPVAARGLFTGPDRGQAQTPVPPAPAGAAGEPRDDLPGAVRAGQGEQPARRGRGRDPARPGADPAARGLEPAPCAASPATPRRSTSASGPPRPADPPCPARGRPRPDHRRLHLQRRACHPGRAQLPGLPGPIAALPARPHRRRGRGRPGRQDHHLAGRAAPLADLGLRHRDGRRRHLQRRHRRAGPLPRPAPPLAARHQREHQRPDPLLPAPRHRPVRPHPRPCSSTPSPPNSTPAPAAPWVTPPPPKPSTTSSLQPPLDTKRAVWLLRRPACPGLWSHNP